MLCRRRHNIHLVRNALRPVARRDAAAVAAQLRVIYTAPGEDAALEALAAFAATDLGRRYPQAVRVWEDAWDAFTPFLAFSPPVRKLLYTTNSIESLNLPAAQGHQGPGSLPVRRRRHQAALAGDHQHRGQARPRARRPTARNRQAPRPARTSRRRTTRHGLARSTQRTRHRLPRTNQVNQTSRARGKRSHTPEVTTSPQGPVPVVAGSGGEFGGVALGAEGAGQCGVPAPSPWLRCRSTREISRL
jgi:hypothetical protein